VDNRSKEIEHLARKLNVLIGKQDVLSKEISEIKSALDHLQEEGAASQVGEEVQEVSQPPVEKATEVEKTLEVEATAVKAGDTGKIQAESSAQTSVEHAKVSEAKPKSGITDIQAGQKATRRWGLPESVQSNLEDFIGTNLINKIGILILIIGISIGTKFAIDRDLISPLVRLILGYVLGAGLLFFAYRLKRNYHNFSAVLCSGAMAILYFMTFAGVVFLDLISITPAFIVMVVVTVFTVYQALAYDRQVIAILGLVGAYAIPFLIGDDPDAYVFLFSYIAIINAGILVIAIRKYWKLLFYTAFTLHLHRYTHQTFKLNLFARLNILFCKLMRVH